MTTIQFIKKALSQNTEFSINQNQIGNSRINTWGNSIGVNLSGREYSFARKGFWKQGFNVYDTENQTLIADIEFAAWTQKINIVFDNQAFTLKKESIWNSNYDLFSNDNKLIEIRYTTQFWNTEGKINCLTDDSEKMKLLGIICITAIDIQRRRAAAAAA